MTTALTVQDLGREKIELIKQTVAKGATDLELELFLHACNHTGLDPLMKQIYAIKRWSQAEGREMMSFQTGVDGLRLIADRTERYAGSSDAIFEERDGKPLLAQVTVLKIVGGEKCAFTASARWDEYVQKNRQMEPTSMWKKMPFLMLAKCAESLALRKAFPMELSKIYAHEEMVHLDTEWKDSLQGSPSDMTARSEQPLSAPLVKPLTQRLVEQPEPAQGDGLDHVDSHVASPVSQDAPAPLDDPAEPYRVRLRVCERTKQAMTHTYNAIPEEIRQDCHLEYQAQLRSLDKKK